jgi:O-antigen/teichoic acid export membrane protein
MSALAVPQSARPSLFREWGRRVWDSPTANTWVSLFTRSASLMLVLPLVLRKFSDVEAAVWFVFSAVLAVQGIIGFGFSPSFARLLSYARAGASVEQMADLRDARGLATSGETNWTSVGRLVACMGRIFAALTVASALLMATIGSWAVWKPIAATGHSSQAWFAWGVIVAGSSLSFWVTHYVSILQGMNRLAEWRRWETVLSLGSIFSAFFVLLAGGKLLGIALAYQAWTIVGLLLYRAICRPVLEPVRSGPAHRWERPVFAVAWNSAWKSGLTNILTFGLVQSTGIIQAQFGSPDSIATYNFMLRLVTLIGQVAQAPFLTKLPELARLRALGDLAAQRQLLARGMRLTHWSVVAAVAAVAVAMPLGLGLIKSKSVTFDPILWVLFGTNLFFERLGGMLHQVRNLTNHPMEHFGMFGYFTLTVTLMVLVQPVLGMYAYPVAMLATQLLFAVWFNGAIAYHVIGVSALRFERTSALPAFAALMIIAYLLVFGSKTL